MKSIRGHAIHRSALLVAALGIILANVGPASALINRYFTPVDLVNNAETIARVQLGPMPESGPIAVTVDKLLLGEKKPEIQLELPRDIAARNALRAAVGDRKATPALVFIGSFEEAVEARVSDAPDGSMLVGTTWLALHRQQDNVYRLAPDPLRLRTVWAGSSGMLERAVSRMIEDIDFAIPVSVDVTWAGDARIGAIAGKVHAVMPLRLPDEPRPAVLVLSEGGDRVFRQGDERGTFEDITARVGLITHSHRGGWADLNGDGHADFLSYNGKALQLLAADGKRRLTPGPSLAWPHGCLSIDAAPVPGGVGIVMATGPDGAPVLLALADGKLQIEKLPLPADGEAREKLGQAGPCAVADFDGDHRPDIAHLWEGGVVLYRGQADGAYAKPALACGQSVGRTLRSAIVGDYDADGRPDILVAGASNPTVLLNAGEGRFEQATEETGEIPEISKPQAIGLAPCDINNDGRQDFAVFYRQMGAQLFFGRGFNCFGFGVETNLLECELPGAQALRMGQQAGTMVDVDGDGGEDLVAASTRGGLHVLYRSTSDDMQLGVEVATSSPTPLTVTAWEGDHCLGAQVVGPQRTAFFGKRNRTPLLLKWRQPGGQPQQKRVIVLRKMTVTVP